MADDTRARLRDALCQTNWLGDPQAEAARWREVARLAMALAHEYEERKQIREEEESMSHLEENLLAQIDMAGLPPPVREFRFAPPRRWRTDFAWPEQRLLLEVEGGVFARGRHVRPVGYENDVEKYNAAVLLGFKLIRVTNRMVEDGQALTLVRQVLEAGADE